MPPLQRYYLLNYLESTERAKQPGTTTEVQWVLQDSFRAEKHPGNESRCSLGKQRRSACPAFRSRHRGRLDRDRETAPVQVDSAQLEQFLQEDIYNGRGYWTLMLEPILIGFALMMFLIAGGLQLKEWLGHRIETRTAAWTPYPRAGTAVLLAMELEAEARWHSLAIALAEFPARLVQQAVAQLGHPNFSYPAQSRSQPHPINGRLGQRQVFGHPANPPPDCPAGRDGHRLRSGAGVHAGVLLARARRSDSQPARHAVPLLGHRR